MLSRTYLGQWLIETDGERVKGIKDVSIDDDDDTLIRYFFATHNNSKMQYALLETFLNNTFLKS